MTILQMKIFIAAADLGSFSAAAEELYISQSSFSKQIKSLEDEIGAPLFTRTHNRVILTDVGKTFLKYARSIYSTYLSMRRNVDTMLHLDQKITFTLGSLPLMHEYCIAEQLTKFQEDVSNVQINLVEANQPFLLQELDRGSIELAIVRIDYLSREKYKIFPISVDQLELVCTREKGDKFIGHAVSLRDVKDEDFVLLDDSDIYTLSMNCFVELGITPRVKYTSSRHLYLLSMVSSGLGICLLPKNMVNLKMFPNLISIPFEESVSTAIGIVMNRNNTISPCANLLFQYFADNGLGTLPNT